MKTRTFSFIVAILLISLFAFQGHYVIADTSAPEDAANVSEPQTTNLSNTDAKQSDTKQPDINLAQITTVPGSRCTASECCCCNVGSSCMCVSMITDCTAAGGTCKDKAKYCK